MFMATSPNNAVLITGANSGIGKEVARQFAESDTFDSIYLACRNMVNAEAALAELERTTDKSIFTTVPMDTSDLASVRAAIDLIQTPLRAVVMNAGGMGGSTPMALTKDGVTEIFASNVLGHVALLEQLIDADALTTSAILVGSEAARGVLRLGMKPPRFSEHSVNEFASVIDGSIFAGQKVDRTLAYAQVKYLGALWMCELARHNAQLRLVTVSPGNTAGTDVFRSFGSILRPLMNGVLMPYVLPRLGLAHALSAGANRLVDAAVTDELESGRFYASAAKVLTGPLVDQADILADFADPTTQGNAYEAIHRFL
jgi:NAD(P)-dependent dehydrogenase (short-subunit alcohol dehydrogenase family)